MNIECPHCKIELEALPEHYGQVVECVSCGNDITIQTPKPPPVPKQATRECPFCSEEIKPTAKKCKHCGEFLDESLRSAVQSSKKVFSHNLSNIPPNVFTPAWMIGLGLLLLFVGIGLMGVSCNATKVTDESVFQFIFGLLILVAGAVFLTTKQIKCKSCSFEGAPKKKGGGSGLVFIFLLCFGIIPGILYLIFVGRQQLICPKCGAST